MTPNQAKELKPGTILYHKNVKNADGTALRAKVNGKVQTWKTRPLDYLIPMKHGLKDYFYLSPVSINSWSLTEPTTKKK